MHGEYKITVKNKRNKYSFSLKRNISILQGDSGRGKTTLFDMIHEYNRFGKTSGVSISCDKLVLAVTGEDWKETITNNPDSIIVIDEDNRFIVSKEFAKVVNGSDNYYLIITRNITAQLPISVDEIFTVSGNKNKKFERIYKDIDKMNSSPRKSTLPFKPQLIITEDSNSGFQFFNNIAYKHSIQCESAGGKSNILNGSF